MHQIDWETVDKSEWGKCPDPEIAALYGVSDHVIAYWRKQFGIPSYDEWLLDERDRQYARGRHWCSTCQAFLPVDQFGRAHKGRFGLRAECKVCRKSANTANQEKLRQKRQDYYRQHGEKIRERNRTWRHRDPLPRLMRARERYNRTKKLFVELIGGECQRCGYREFSSGLDFHHIDKKQKDTLPVNVIRNGDYDRAYAELDKCALLCKNCHQAFHAGEWQCEFVKRDGLGWAILSHS